MARRVSPPKFRVPKIRPIRVPKAKAIKLPTGFAQHGMTNRFNPFSGRRIAITTEQIIRRLQRIKLGKVPQFKVKL